MEIPQRPADAEKVLTGEPLSLGYRPALPLAGWWGGDGNRPNYQQLLMDVEAMLHHPRVKIALDYYRSGISSAKFKVRANSEEVGEFALRQLRRFWQRSRAQAQRTYEYGRCGYEVCYTQEEGKLVFDCLIDFFPLDVHVLTHQKKYAGVRVRGAGDLASGGRGNVLDLWGPGYWPSKGLWLAHNRRYHRWYGLTQLYGAWRPWRRLACRDGGEEIVDGGVYRFAYTGPVVYYPAEGYKRRNPLSGQMDPVDARELARELAENVKAGVSVAFPVNTDEKGQITKKWELVWPQHVLNVDSLLNYTAYLEKQISLGIGVPPELLEAAEAGSGYSGRRIPLEAFLCTQQLNAEDLVHEWVWQIGLPLCRWNFGPESWFEVEVQSLLETMQQGKLSQPPGSQGAPAPGGGGNPVDPLAALLNGEGASGGEASESPPGQLSLEAVFVGPCWQEYQRPNGGRGWRHSQTGEVILREGDYGSPVMRRAGSGARPTVLALPAPASAPASPVERAEPRRIEPEKVWMDYTGRRGRRKGQHGWRNRRTGRVVWDEGSPAMGSSGPEVTPANVEHLLDRIKLLRSGESPLTPESVRRVTEQILSLPVKEIALLRQLLPLGLTPEDVQEIKAVLEEVDILD